MYRHHNEPRVQLGVPKEETFSIPLKYIDVTRSTHTDLDVMQEKRIDDYWNVDENRSLSDSWTGFTMFALLMEKPTPGFMWSCGRLTRIQATTTPDHVWPEIWIKIGKSAQKKEKEEWAKGNPSSITLEKWEEFTWSILKTRNIKKSSKKCEKEDGKTPPEAPVHCKSEQKLHQADKKLERNWKHPKRFQRQSTRA